MLTPTAVLDQYAWLYQEKIPEPAGTWDIVFPVDGSYSAAKVVDGTVYLMFRGSVTFMDWRQDFQDFALPVYNAFVGFVHPGFLVGATAIQNQLDEFIGDRPLVVVGHSLGAGHACVYSATRRAINKRVDGLVLFGSPKPGGAKIVGLLRDVPVQSYRNANADGHDLVTDVPFTDFPKLPYQHVTPLTDCRHDPDPLDPWLLFRYHHLKHYAKAFGAAGPAVLALK